MLEVVSTRIPTCFVASDCGVAFVLVEVSASSIGLDTEFS
jgi:hypothetical protein